MNLNNFRSTNYFGKEKSRKQYGVANSIFKKKRKDSFNIGQERLNGLKKNNFMQSMMRTQNIK